MSLYTDQKYITQMSHLLIGYTKKKDYLWNFRCPYCGDSKEKKQKKRGYVYRKTNGLFYMCHNCGVSTTLGNLIKFLSPELHKEYLMEEYKDSQNGRQRSSKGKLEKMKPIKSAKPNFTKQSKTERLIKSMESNVVFDLPDDDPVKKYLVGRMIPEENLKEMFVVDDFKEYVDLVLPDNEYNLVKNDKRIVIPMRTKDGTLVGFQGRAIGKSNLRYITIKVREDLPKVYGMDKWNPKEKTYILEGPIDSMFLPNAIAMAGSDMTFEVDKSNSVVILDNEKRNSEITRRMKKLISDGYNVVIFPDSIEEKDINDMILAGRTKDEILEIIDRHTYSGLKAKVVFGQWVR